MVAALALGLASAACDGGNQPAQAPTGPAGAPAATVGGDTAPTPTQVVATPAPVETRNPGTPAVSTITIDETVIPAVTVTGVPTANVTATAGNTLSTPEATGTATEAATE